MIHWDTGKVIDCIQSRHGIQDIRVRLSSGNEAKAIHYTDVLPPLQVDDEVLLNTTAVDLGLGTGGYHFVYAKKSMDLAEKHDSYQPTVKGHMMKLRYTPQQRTVLAAEEEGSAYHELFKERRSLEGMPVLIGELHSMLPIAVCWIRYVQTMNEPHTKLIPKLAYVMSDGGALPLYFSNHAALLKNLNWIHGSVTYGHAFGGDLETMNKFTALIAAKHILNADIAIAAMGPGIAGTGTWMGHTGVEVGELVNAVSLLGGIPIVIPRISFAENRDRHQGMSHHILTSLSAIALKRAIVPLPANVSADQRTLLAKQIDESGCDQLHEILWIADVPHRKVKQSLQLYPENITTMGRGLDEDTAFFLGVCAAAQYAWNQWNCTILS